MNEQFEVPSERSYRASEERYQKMKYRRCGKSGLDLPQISLGLWHNFGFTDKIENVPEEYREIGMTITMENDKGEPKKFIVTRFDDETLTVDGNNPLCGRNVVFRLEGLSIRDANDEEIEIGGAIGADPSLDEILK